MSASKRLPTSEIEGARRFHAKTKSWVKQGWWLAVVTGSVLALACGGIARNDASPSSDYQPCAGKQCGAGCRECAPDDATCEETAVAKYCFRGGACKSGFPLCDTAICASDADCPALEQACLTCRDGHTACPSNHCQGGECAASYPSCADACQSNADCSAFPSECVQCFSGVSSNTCSSLYCIAGHCVLACPPADPCTTTFNCPFFVDSCTSCPGASCAQNDCINGACQQACPP